MAEPQAKAPALLVDAMLGNLSRRLRWLGYDAEYRNDLPDEEMMRIARDQKRLLITRDRALAGRRGVQALYVAATDLDEQIQAVVDALGPSPGPARCTVCNGGLEPLSPEQAAPLVPPYVARTQTDFRRCTRCQRVYWPGTHWQGLQAWGNHPCA
jgi:uncharacterized protein with PIN domain